jgi:hypothetical protein
MPPTTSASSKRNTAASASKPKTAAKPALSRTAVKKTTGTTKSASGAKKVVRIAAPKERATTSSKPAGKSEAAAVRYHTPYLMLKDGHPQEIKSQFTGAPKAAATKAMTKMAKYIQPHESVKFMMHEKNTDKSRIYEGSYTKIPEDKLTDYQRQRKITTKSVVKSLGLANHVAPHQGAKYMLVTESGGKPIKVPVVCTKGGNVNGKFKVDRTVKAFDLKAGAKCQQIQTDKFQMEGHAEAMVGTLKVRA